MGHPLVPLNDFTAIEAYVAAGACELYVGFFDDDWHAAFGPFADINRMSGFRFEANAYSFDEVCAAAPFVNSLGARLYVTFNAASYSARQHPWLSYYMGRLAEAGCAGVIISSPELVRIAHEAGIEAVASTMCGIYNVQIAAYYASLGVRRLILPRDLSLEEISAIVAGNPGLEYEVFLMRNGCIYSDSHCLGQHGLACGALCGEMRAGERILRSARDLGACVEASDLYFESFHTYACGLCALWDLERIGVDAYKVVGRGDGSESICEDIELVSANIAIARECESREEYLLRMRPNPWADLVCDRTLSCYYPEVSRLHL